MGSRLDKNSKATNKRIAAHTFDNDDGEEYSASKFGGFSDYMRRKKIKLQNRDAVMRAQSDKPAIFRNTVIHINGYTQPSLNELHDLIVTHGGGYIQYLDAKTSVTHIVASQLTPKKKVEFAKYRVVRPAWVVDSVKAGKMLTWNQYRLLDEGEGQKVLTFASGSMQAQPNIRQDSYFTESNASRYAPRYKELADRVSRGLATPKMDYSNDPKDTPCMTESFSWGDHQQSSGELPSTQSNCDPEILPAAQPSGEDASFEDAAAAYPGLANDPASNDESDTALQPTISEENENRVLFPEAVTGEKQQASLGDVDSEAEEHGWIQPDDTEVSDVVDTPAVDVGAIEPGRALTAEEHNAILLQNPHMAKSSTANPDFVAQYYRESRLHHLSMWKAELKLRLLDRAAKLRTTQKKRIRLPGVRRYVMHIDFDSFFAAVSLRKHPHLKGNPVVIAHGSGPGSEIASCNYPAREFGVRNGQWMKYALELCPHLKVLPYDYDDYETASKHFYDAILAVDGVVQSISIDEALLDVSEQCIRAGGTNGKHVAEGAVQREQLKACSIASELRDAIRDSTGCEVSIGIGASILLAKVALRKAKPAGQHLIKPEDELAFLADLSVQNLPGVAWSIGNKLELIGVKLVKDIRDLSKEKLIKALGPKTGQKLWNYARGIDLQEVGVQSPRKSVSAEINWGIRFTSQAQAERFICDLSQELSRRLLENLVKGTQLTLKIMRKAADAGMDPPKNLGHGKCDTFNKSTVLGVATNDKELIAREAIAILRGHGFPPGELRGVGIMMQRLLPMQRSSGDATALVDGSQKRLAFKPAPRETVLAQASAHAVSHSTVRKMPTSAGVDSRVKEKGALTEYFPRKNHAPDGVRPVRTVRFQEPDVPIEGKDQASMEPSSDVHTESFAHHEDEGEFPSAADLTGLFALSSTARKNLLAKFRASNPKTAKFIPTAQNEQGQFYLGPVSERHRFRSLLLEAQGESGQFAGPDSAGNEEYRDYRQASVEGWNSPRFADALGNLFEHPRYGPDYDDDLTYVFGGGHQPHQLEDEHVYEPVTSERRGSGHSSYTELPEANQSPRPGDSPRDLSDGLDVLPEVGEGEPMTEEPNTSNFSSTVGVSTMFMDIDSNDIPKVSRFLHNWITTEAKKDSPHPGQDEMEYVMDFFRRVVRDETNASKAVVLFDSLAYSVENQYTDAAKRLAWREMVWAIETMMQDEMHKQDYDSMTLVSCPRG